MKIGNILAATLIAAGLAAGGIAGAGTAQAATPAGTAIAKAVTAGAVRDARQLTLQELLDTVRYRVHETFPGATLMTAEGNSPSGSTRDMLNVTDWLLVYNTNDASSRIKSLQIHATLAGQIDAPTYYTSPWGGVVAIPDHVGMPIEQAYHILTLAGLGDAYKYVSLVKPLVANPKLQYHFSHTPGGCDGYAVNVDDGFVQTICG